MRRTNRFPIVRLPLLPLEMVTKDLEFLDIFYLASCSKRIHQNLRRVRLNLKNVRLKGSYSRSKVRISMLYELDKSFEFVLKPVSSMDWRKMNRFENDFLNIDGKTYKVPIEQEDQILQFCEKTDSGIPKESLFSVIKLLSELFKAHEVSFRCTENQKRRSYRKCLKLSYPKYFRPFFTVVTESPEPWNPPESYRGKYPFKLPTELTSDELSYLLENFPVKNFKLDWDVEEGVKYRKSLKYPRMTLRKAHWLTIDSLLNMECEHLEARAVSFTKEDWKKFVEKWLEGRFENLDSVEFDCACEGLMEDYENQWNMR